MNDEKERPPANSNDQPGYRVTLVVEQTFEVEVDHAASSEEAYEKAVDEWFRGRREAEYPENRTSGVTNGDWRVMTHTAERIEHDLDVYEDWDCER